MRYFPLLIAGISVLLMPLAAKAEPIRTRAQEAAKRDAEFKASHPFLIAVDAGPGSMHERGGDGLIADGGLGFGVGDLTSQSATESGGWGVGAGGLFRSARDRLDGLYSHGAGNAAVTLYRPGAHLQGEAVVGKKFTDWKIQPQVGVGLGVRAGASHGYLQNYHPDWSSEHSSFNGLRQAAVTPSLRGGLAADLNDLNDFVSVSGVLSGTARTDADPETGENKYLSVGGNVTLVHSRKLVSITAQKPVTGPTDQTEVDLMLAAHLGGWYMGFSAAVTQRDGPKYDPNVTYVPDDSIGFQGTFVLGRAYEGAN